MDVPVYTINGQPAGTMTIDENALGGEINAPLIKQAYVHYHANLRQGSARVRMRSMGHFSTKKIYKQKGTGRARHGDRNVNTMRGGSRAFGKTKTREDYRLAMPKKMKRKANRNALLAKLLDGEVKVIESLSMSKPETKAFKALMETLGLNRTTLVALSNDPAQSENARRSARNLADVTLARADQLTAFEMLNHRFLVIGKDDLLAWLAGPSSQTGKDAKTDPAGRQEKRVRVRKNDPRKARAAASKTATGGEG